MSDLFSQMMALSDLDNDRLKKIFPYMGSKLSSVDHILPHLPNRKIYVEPCAGSGAILLNRSPSKVDVFNDLCSGVTSFYKCIQDPIKIKELSEKIQLTIHSREFWEWCSETWNANPPLDIIEKAFRWYYCLMMSVNHKQRAFARSTLKSKAYYGSKLRDSIKSFYPIHERLLNVQIECLDWRQCLQDFDSEETVFYIDPPYLGPEKYYFNSWTTDDHLEMCERIQSLKGFVAVSGFEKIRLDHDFKHPYDKFPWTNKISWKVTMQLSFDFDKRKPATETLWIKDNDT